MCQNFKIPFLYKENQELREQKCTAIVVLCRGSLTSLILFKHLWMRKHNQSPEAKNQTKRGRQSNLYCNAGYRDHTTPLFKSQKILPLDEMVKLSNLKFLHKYTHNRLPLSFHETWVFNRDRNINRVLRNANDFFVPAHHFATLRRLSLFTFPRLWN